jgi:hypothetical protein
LLLILLAFFSWWRQSVVVVPDGCKTVREAGGGRRGRQEAALQLVEAGHLHRRYYAEIPVQRAHQASPNCSLSGLPTLLLARLLPQLTQNGNTVEDAREALRDLGDGEG